MKVKFKKIVDNAVIPSYANPSDAGVDLTATSYEYKDGVLTYGTGISIEIPNGYVGLIFPRSSNCKKDLLLCNSVGVIDSGYRGEIIFKFTTNKWSCIPITLWERLKMFFKGKFSDGVKMNVFANIDDSRIYHVGDRVGQLIIIKRPEIEFVEKKNLSKTKRGKGGFGSTGN